MHGSNNTFVKWRVLFILFAGSASEFDASLEWYILSASNTWYMYDVGHVLIVGCNYIIKLLFFHVDNMLAFKALKFDLF